jgi:hypothetical protein
VKFPGVRTWVLLGVGLSLVAPSLEAAPPPAFGAGNSYHFLKSPIAQAGSIPPGGSQPFTIAVTANGLPVSGATVNVRYSQISRLSSAETVMPAGQCNVSQLSTRGDWATCRTDSTGRVTMTYVMPSPLPAQGSVEWQANGGSGTHTIVTHYVSSAVYTFDHSPMATSGSLTPGQSVSSNLDIRNASLQPMPGGTAFLSFRAAPGGGTAWVGSTQLTATPAEFVADALGRIPLTYTAPSTLPGSGVDQIVAQDLSSNPSETNSSSYSFSPGTPVISIGDVSAAEAWTPPIVPAKFTVTVTPTEPYPISFTWTNLCGIGDKWCSEDLKVVTTPKTVTIPAGHSQTTVTTNLYSYGGANGGEHYNEGWFVVIAAAQNGTQIGKSVGTGVQIEADPGESLLIGDAASPATSDAAGTKLYFTVTSTNTPSTPLSFSYTTLDSTAKAGTDYVATQGTATIPAGSNTAIIPVQLLPEGVLSVPRVFSIVISGAPSGIPIARSVGTGTILVPGP